MSKRAGHISFSASTSVHPAEKIGNGLNEDLSYLSPSYYLKRPDGTCTALIEADQLPELIRLRYVPSKLSLADTAGMTSVGIKDWDQKKYTIEIVHSSADFYPGETTSLFKHTVIENASFTPKANPAVLPSAPSSSQAPVSQIPQIMLGTLLIYTIEGRLSSITLTRYSNNPPSYPSASHPTTRQIKRQGQKGILHVLDQPWRM